MGDSIKLKYVAGKQRPFDANGKSFIDYGVKVEGNDDEWFSFVQFANQPAPVAGDTIEELEVVHKDKYNDQLRGKLVRSVSSNGAGPGLDVHPSADDRQISIVRQHSQEMAIRWLARQPKPEAYTLEDLREVITWFERDAWGDDPTAPTAIERVTDNDIQPENTAADDGIPF